MKLHFVAIPVYGSGEAEAALNRFLAEHRVVSVDRELVVNGTPMGSSGRGLPIGALTSQYLANTYLGGLDRHLLGDARVRGYVRYMDDVLWWCSSRGDARATRDLAVAWAWDQRGLELKQPVQIGRSEQGVTFLGFRVRRGALRLSRRRKRRYAAARQRAELAFAQHGDPHRLQREVDAAVAITSHADAAAWRRQELARRPPVDA